MCKTPTNVVEWLSPCWRWPKCIWTPVCKWFPLQEDSSVQQDKTLSLVCLGSTKVQALLGHRVAEHQILGRKDNEDRRLKAFNQALSLRLWEMQSLHVLRPEQRSWREASWQPTAPHSERGVSAVLCSLVMLTEPERTASSCVWEYQVGYQEKLLHQWMMNISPEQRTPGPNLTIFKEHLDKALRHRIWILGGPLWKLWRWDLDLMVLVSPFRLRTFCAFMIWASATWPCALLRHASCACSLAAFSSLMLTAVFHISGAIFSSQLHSYTLCH